MTNKQAYAGLNTTLNGVEQPERIWLICYRHAGDVCWTSDPNPEDADEIETVEYVRAEAISSLLKALERAPTVVLEQRCERGTPWDLACVTIAEKMREHVAVALNSDAPLSIGEGDRG